MSRQLTPTSYLVLGTLATAGAMTPYELKQAVLAGVGYFWSFPHSQLYSEPAALAEDGLVTEQRETSGRRRRIFTISASGRAALRAWLADPTPALPEIRDVGLLKLFFSDLASTADIVALARAQAEAHDERRSVYAAISAAAPPGSAGATVRLGLAYERAAAEFWRNVASDPPVSG